MEAVTVAGDISKSGSCNKMEVEINGMVRNDASGGGKERQEVIVAVVKGMMKEGRRMNRW